LCQQDWQLLRGSIATTDLIGYYRNLQGGTCDVTHSLAVIGWRP